MRGETSCDDKRVIVFSSRVRGSNSGFGTLSLTPNWFGNILWTRHRKVMAPIGLANFQIGSVMWWVARLSTIFENGFRGLPTAVAYIRQELPALPNSMLILQAYPVVAEEPEDEALQLERKHCTFPTEANVQLVSFPTSCMQEKGISKRRRPSPGTVTPCYFRPRRGSHP
jgi:hypothetical protein